MTARRNKLYLLLSVAFIGAYTYLGFHFIDTQETAQPDFCIIKQVADVPCPSCGTTRSVIALSEGNATEAALKYNPLGYLISLILIIGPLWLLADVLRKSSSLFLFYQKFEEQIKKPRFAWPLIILILANWIWNFYKGL